MNHGWFHVNPIAPMTGFASIQYLPLSDWLCIQPILCGSLHVSKTRNRSFSGWLQSLPFWVQSSCGRFLLIMAPLSTCDWLHPPLPLSLSSSVCFPNKKVWVAMREFWRATTPMLCQVFRNVLIACSTILSINVPCSILCFLLIYFKISLGFPPLSVIGCFWFDSKFHLLSFLILIP